MKRRLYRSTREKMLAGVAGGLAEYFEVDPVLVRLAFVLLFFFNGVGLLLYIVAIFIIPRDDAAYRIAPENVSSESSQEGEIKSQNEQESEKKSKSRMIFGAILMVVGGLLLLSDVFPSVDFGDILPLVLLGLGSWLVYPYLSSRKEVNQ
ncbi:MAG: PspC domain-containing protein [Ignavibacteriales bacterium]|nr:PspC domain-containing protein [Ignavibacteriaceae bacterium]QOJ29079.1 MAG: PspC domain-containing protein [Ignavibacteriales bacterium]